MRAQVDVSAHRSLSTARRVFKRDGTTYSPVAEAELEPYGFGLDPDSAVEAYRAERNDEARHGGREPWDYTTIQVYPDEECGYETRRFRLTLDMGVYDTRSQKALRRIGRYLIDLSNGVEDPSGFFGKGLELVEERQ